MSGVGRHTVPGNDGSFLLRRSAAMSRAELTGEEHAARQLCKLLGAGPLDGERLRARWIALRHEMSGRRRPALPASDWAKVLAEAVARGWIAEQDGCLATTEAGHLIAKRSRAATGKTRSARLRGM
jgi:hypothetical protein